MADIVPWLVSTAILWLCCVGVTLPFVVIAAHSKPGLDRRAILLLGFFLVTLALAGSERAVRLLRSPWQGMILQAVFALLVIAFSKSTRDCGLTRDIAVGSRDWRAGAWATVLLLLFVVVRSLALWPSDTRHLPEKLKAGSSWRIS